MFARERLSQSGPCSSHSQQAQIVNLQRSAAEAESRESVARRRRDALEAQVDAVESELVRLREEKESIEGRIRAQTEALNSLNGSLSELREARRKTSAAALSERERFSEELAAINERCVQVRGIPELMSRYAAARETHARVLSSLTRGGNSTVEADDDDDARNIINIHKNTVEVVPGEVQEASEALKVRLRALLDVREKKVAEAAERLRG